MRLKNVLIVVKDIERSRKFYHDLFGLETILDNDGNMILTEGLVLQDETIWKKFLGKDRIPQNNACELYFEERNIENFVQRLKALYPETVYVNHLMIHRWGQKVVRFYDPDGNLIEVGTPMRQKRPPVKKELPPIKTWHYQTCSRNAVYMDLLLDKPDDHENQYPLVIILHGLTGYKEEAHLAALSKRLGEFGIASLRADLFGHGANTGVFKDHTLQKWVIEIRRLIENVWMCGQYSEVYLCGHSQGALCAFMAAAEEHNRIINGVIALAPALKIPEQARQGTLFGLSFDPNNVPDKVTVWDKSLSGDYIREAQTVRPEDITAFKGPVLFVHSDSDERVPLAVSSEAVKQFADAKLVVTHGDTHDFDKHPEVMAQAVLDWLLQLQ